jgi:ectoine hydroxylase-related dioxygenase (phytanoyl-CoA dioxygenase family)
MYLPHSQKYDEGYVAWRQPEFIDYFAHYYVQLPLRSGDAVFFNPALFHAAGANHTTDISRMANLLQISSAFGRAMETVDRRAMTLAVYDALLARVDAGLVPEAVEHVVAATAEGYAFPTNLDRDQPLDGLSPPAQADVLRAALHARWPLARLRSELEAQDRRRSSGSRD